MLLRLLESSWLRVSTHMVIIGNAVVWCLRGDPLGYLLALLAATVVVGDLVASRRRCVPAAGTSSTRVPSLRVDGE